MSWTSGDFDGPLTAQTAIAFGLGEEFASRVVDAVLERDVVYAAVRSADEERIFGLVLMIERQGGRLQTKPIGDEMGPVKDHCPARILDLFTAPSNDLAREWRDRCRANLASERFEPVFS